MFRQSAFDIDLNLDQTWCAWFSGWIDGEGCFTARLTGSNNGAISCGLRVRVRDDDTGLICSVKDTVKCGRIFSDSMTRNGTNPQIIWNCSNLSACRNILIPLFDKYPLQSKKMRDYQVWREIVMNLSEGWHLNRNLRCNIIGLCEELSSTRKYVSPEISGGDVVGHYYDYPLFYSWFSGWVDGEGCFVAQESRRDRSISCVLRVGVRDDDSPLVNFVWNAIQCGTVGKKPKYKTSNPIIEWRCYDVGEQVQILIPVLDSCPLHSKKSSDYKIWREIVMLVSEKQHLNGNREYVLDLCQQLRDVKRYTTHS